MTTEVFLLACATVLGLVQLGAAALGKRRQEPPGWQEGPRDEPPPRYTGYTARLMRVQDNFMETFPFFAAAVLVAHAAGRESALSIWGAELYFWGRVVYVPLYVFGVRYARSLVWAVAATGLVLVLVRALLPG